MNHILNGATMFAVIENKRNKKSLTAPHSREWTFYRDKKTADVQAINRPYIRGCKKNNFYSASATTSFTSGIMRFIMPSIPALSVIMEDGQPLQLPCSIRFTTPSS